MAELTDTHCHIQSAGLDQGERTTRELWAKAPELTPETIIAGAAAEDVTRLVCVGCDLADSRLAVDFVQDRESCWASVGLHPHEAQHYAGQPAKLKQFAALASQPKVVAIGECGLDFFYTHSPKADQLEVLKFQIELAQKHDLPLIFHVREAFDDFWPVFEGFAKNHPGLRGVLHSFTDSQANLERALSHGLYIGVNGIATFAKDEKLLAVYRTVPLTNLLLETDAPFLTPHPYRGTVNEPKHVGTVASYLAKLRGQERDLIVSTTTGNARQLFGL